jgi:hypothetical protein
LYLLCFGVISNLFKYGFSLCVVSGFRSRSHLFEVFWTRFPIKPSDFSNMIPIIQSSKSFDFTTARIANGTITSIARFISKGRYIFCLIASFTSLNHVVTLKWSKPLDCAIAEVAPCQMACM